MVPANDNRKQSGSDRRAKPRKTYHGRRQKDRRKVASAKPGSSYQNMLFPALLFVAYLLIARPVSEPVASVNLQSCNPETEYSLISPVLEPRAAPAPAVSKKKNKNGPKTVKRHFRPRNDIGPSVTFAPSKRSDKLIEQEIVLDDATIAATAAAAKGRFPSSIARQDTSKSAQQTADLSDGSDLDVSDDFTVGVKRKESAR